MMLGWFSKSEIGVAAVGRRQVARGTVILSLGSDLVSTQTVLGILVARKVALSRIRRTLTLEIPFGCRSEGSIGT